MSDQDINLSNVQRMFNEPDFELLVQRLEGQFFEAWRRSQNEKDRERIHCKVEVLEELVNSMRAIADSIAFETVRKINNG